MRVLMLLLLTFTLTGCQTGASELEKAKVRLELAEKELAVQVKEHDEFMRVFRDTPKDELTPEQAKVMKESFEAVERATKEKANAENALRELLD